MTSMESTRSPRRDTKKGGPDLSIETAPKNYFFVLSIIAASIAFSSAISLC